MQVLKGKYDERVDYWSFGVILYAMLPGSQETVTFCVLALLAARAIDFLAAYLILSGSTATEKFPAVVANLDQHSSANSSLQQLTCPNLSGVAGCPL